MAIRDEDIVRSLTRWHRPFLLCCSSRLAWVLLRPYPNSLLVDSTKDNSVLFHFPLDSSPLRTLFIKHSIRERDRWRTRRLIFTSGWRCIQRSPLNRLSLDQFDFDLERSWSRERWRWDESTYIWTGDVETRAWRIDRISQIEFQGIISTGRWNLRRDIELEEPREQFNWCKRLSCLSRWYQ